MLGCFNGQLNNFHIEPVDIYPLKSFNTEMMAKAIWFIAVYNYSHPTNSTPTLQENETHEKSIKMFQNQMTSMFRSIKNKCSNLK